MSSDQYEIEDYQPQLLGFLELLGGNFSEDRWREVEMLVNLYSWHLRDLSLEISEKVTDAFLEKIIHRKNRFNTSDSAIAYSESGTEQVFSCGHAGKSGSGAVPENYYSIWVEINRTTDSTFNVKIFSDSDYKNLVASEYKTGLSGITNLRYINVESMDASGSNTNTAEFGAWLRDIRLYNNGRLPCNVEDGSYVYLQDTGVKFIYNDSIKDWEEV